MAGAFKFLIYYATSFIKINKGNKIYDGLVEQLVDDHNEEKMVKFYFETTPTNDLWYDSLQQVD